MEITKYPAYILLNDIIKDIAHLHVTAESLKIFGIYSNDNKIEAILLFEFNDIINFNINSFIKKIDHKLVGAEFNLLAEYECYILKQIINRLTTHQRKEKIDKILE